MKIIKRKLTKGTIKKYGWRKNYYEIMKGKSTYGFTNTKKEALKLVKRLNLK
jgi:hypothetical protein